MDNDSQVDIIIHNMLLRMGYIDHDLEPSNVPLYGFGGKRVEPAGRIKLTISFGNTGNPRSEFITFEVVRLIYPYFAILKRATINTFEVVIHDAYLRKKIPTKNRGITVMGDQ